MIQGSEGSDIAASPSMDQLSLQQRGSGHMSSVHQWMSQHDMHRNASPAPGQCAHALLFHNQCAFRAQASWPAPTKRPHCCCSSGWGRKSWRLAHTVQRQQPRRLARHADDQAAGGGHRAATSSQRRCGRRRRGGRARRRGLRHGPAAVRRRLRPPHRAVLRRAQAPARRARQMRRCVTSLLGFPLALTALALQVCRLCPRASRSSSCRAT